MKRFFRLVPLLFFPTLLAYPHSLSEIDDDDDEYDDFLEFETDTATFLSVAGTDSLRLFFDDSYFKLTATSGSGSVYRISGTYKIYDDSLYLYGWYPEDDNENTEKVWEDLVLERKEPNAPRVLVVQNRDTSFPSFILKAFDANGNIVADSKCRVATFFPREADELCIETSDGRCLRYIPEWYSEGATDRIIMLLPPEPLITNSVWKLADMNTINVIDYNGNVVDTLHRIPSPPEEDDN